MTNCYFNHGLYNRQIKGPEHLPRLFKALYEEQFSEAGIEQFSSQIVRGRKKSNQSTKIKQMDLYQRICICKDQEDMNQ